MSESKTVLIVDDAATDRETYRRYLLKDRHYSYQILSAETGAEGLELYSTRKPDIILLDYELPDMDGLEILNKLSQTDQETQPPVLMLTGYGSEEVAVAAMKSGAIDYLVKGNFTPETLHHTIERAWMLQKQKQYQIALEKSQKRYAILAELSPVGIFYTGLDGDCLYVNQRWCAIAGITIKQALGRGWVNSIHPDDRDRVFDEWYQAALISLPFSSEYRFQNPDAITTWVLGQAVAEKDSSGKIRLFRT